ncbi:MAG: hypothetical protein ACKVXR_15250 [Planctomycetota bacterium]
MRLLPIHMLLLAGLTSPVFSQTTEDVKTPAPPAPLKTDAVTFDRRASSAPRPKPDPEMEQVPSAFGRSRRPVEMRQVAFDEPGDGALWARGTSYKLRFDSSGATYMPRFGPRAERNLPVSFRLADATAGGETVLLDASAPPSRQGDSVAFDRGAIVERYDLGLENVEQLFVVDAPLPSGELVLHIAVESELDATASAAGLEFRGAPGFVRYGRATAIDATGASFPAPTSLVDGGIEIRVPEAFLATARFPLVVDPVITTFPVEDTFENTYQPDVAFNATSNQYAVVFEIPFSGPDPDVYVEIWNTGGFFLYAQWIDSSFTSWAKPRVASLPLHDQFLVVAEVGTAGSRTIWGRTVTSAGFNFGPQFQISGTESGEKLNPDVGGDPHPAGPVYYNVVWERVWSATDHDIHARLVTPSSTLLTGGTILLDNTSFTLDALPAISQSNGGSDWSIVWQREVSVSDHDIHGGRIRWNGQISNVPFTIASTIFDETAPSVSSPLADGQYLVANLHLYLTFPPPNHRAVYGRLMSGSTVLHALDLNDAESLYTSTPNAQDHANIAVESDGSSFVVAYSEQYQTSSTDYDIYVSTFRPVGNRLFVSEVHQNMAFSSSREDHPRLTSTASGAGVAGRFFAVWDDAVGGSQANNTEGALYDRGEFANFCHPTYDGVIACPCANPGVAQIRGCNNSASTGGSYFTGTGAASLAGDTLHLTATGLRPTATGILLQGTTFSATGIVFGQGVRCVAGSLKRLYVKSAVAGTIAVPQPADLTVSAASAAKGDPLSASASRYYLLYYRDPILLGGCPATSNFNATTSGAVTWRP